MVVVVFPFFQTFSNCCMLKRTTVIFCLRDGLNARWHFRAPFHSYRELQIKISFVEMKKIVKMLLHSDDGPRREPQDGVPWRVPRGFNLIRRNIFQCLN